jgi:hypothetical protein
MGRKLRSSCEYSGVLDRFFLFLIIINQKFGILEVQLELGSFDLILNVMMRTSSHERLRYIDGLNFPDTFHAHHRCILRTHCSFVQNYIAALSSSV